MSDYRTISILGAQSPNLSSDVFAMTEGLDGSGQFMMYLPARGAEEERPPRSVGLTKVISLVFAGSISKIKLAKDGPVIRLLTFTVYLTLAVKELS